MKSDRKEVRKKMVVVRLADGEYDQLKRNFDKSICATISEYLRDCALQKPITIKYRNQSADEFLSVALALKKELNAIGNNFNQAVHRLHTLDRIPEFRVWIMTYESTKQLIVEKINDVSEAMDQIYKQWCHA